MKLSENFNLEEFTESKTAKELGIENIPNEQEVQSILLLVQNVLQPLRKLIAVPIKINSGFRCELLNNNTKGSSPTSQHRLGEAADIYVADMPMKNVFNIIKDRLLFDQLIWEFGGKWIHVSYRQGRNRKEVLESKRINDKTIYVKMA